MASALQRRRIDRFGCERPGRCAALPLSAAAAACEDPCAVQDEMIELQLRALDAASRLAADVDHCAACVSGSPAAPPSAATVALTSHRTGVI
jgi:hypothetical protein